MLAVGDQVPEFTLSDQNGESVSLSDFRGRRVFVWFYPKASTPGCTKEGCSLRDHHAEFASQDVEIIGISMDSVRRQKNFATKQGFPYRLLADTDGSVIRAFGVWGPKRFMGREYEGIIRTSFLIDTEGRVAKVFAKVKTRSHGADVLAAL